MRLFLFLAFLFFTSNVSAQIDTTKWFDFWVGTWDATWDEGEGKKGKGINRITKTLDGTVIHENFEILEGQNKDFKGTSISVYQVRFKKWKQAWADNQGGYYDFTGSKNGDERAFQTAVFNTQDGRAITQRMVFKKITDRSMTWDWEASQDGGETWTLNWRIFYTKK
ncbi:MAG: hypothetical protein AAF242_04490 [Bacteroidota bacterium]